MKKYVKNNWIKYVIVVSLVIIDILTKIIFYGKNYTVINGVFDISSSANTGAAFSFLSGKIGVLIAISILFVALFIVYDKFVKSKNKVYVFGYCFIIGGAVGNLIDRVFLGFVRDFIYLPFFDFSGINTVFNVADIFVTAGITLMVVYLLFFSHKENKNEKQV